MDSSVDTASVCFVCVQLEDCLVEGNEVFGYYQQCYLQMDKNLSEHYKIFGHYQYC